VLGLVVSDEDRDTLYLRGLEERAHHSLTIRRTLEEPTSGAVLINEATSWRAEHMPYGGVKDSGTGREGLRSAIESMTEERMLIAQF